MVKKQFGHEIPPNLTDLPEFLQVERSGRVVFIDTRTSFVYDYLDSSGYTPIGLTHEDHARFNRSTSTRSTRENQIALCAEARIMYEGDRLALEQIDRYDPTSAYRELVGKWDRAQRNDRDDEADELLARLTRLYPELAARGLL